MAHGLALESIVCKSKLHNWEDSAVIEKIAEINSRHELCKDRLIKFWGVGRPQNLRVQALTLN